MLTKLFTKTLLPLLLVVSGCVTMPTGPGVLVLPAPGKPFEQFQREEIYCRQWAELQSGGSAQEIANRNTATSAIVGSAIGAGAGAVLGSVTGDTAGGIAFGTGAGLLLGTASGFDAGQYYGAEAQRRYDYAYVQCMYSAGNQIPGQVNRYRIRKVTPPPSRDMVPPDYVPAPLPAK
jgi:hypothetical protein